ncbi:hypothetical protein NQZ68_005737 [Dissostichus eleginoides]|nr:hypothetical protein NQZ68_005737 [Dissostichus eleginoides]
MGNAPSQGMSKISLLTCTAGIRLVLRVVLPNQPAVLLLHSVSRGWGVGLRGSWSAASLQERDAESECDWEGPQ